MPELPEVETIKRDLTEVILNRPISAVILNKAKMVRGSGAEFKKHLIKNSFSGIKRKGKLLALFLKSGEWLLIHLKMTGQLIYQDKKDKLAGGHTYKEAVDNFELPSRFTHIIFKFNDGGALYFNDMRQFGYMQIVSESDRKAIWSRFGIEPLTNDYTLANFGQALKRSRTAPLKAVLLDQTKIAGLGNIYVDEACFAAKIRPDRPISSLTDNEIKLLHQKTEAIIALAIKERGTTFNTYRDSRGRHGNFLSLLKVYGRAGQPCSRKDGGVLKKIKVAGRGTVFCPVCQK